MKPKTNGLAAPDSPVSSVAQAAARSLPVTFFWLCATACLLWFLPERAWLVKKEGVVVFGLFGLWRYLWQLVHIVRQRIYGKTFFPKLRKAAEALEDKYPKRIYFMIASYFELPSISRMVILSVLRECAKTPCEAVMVISVGSEQEIQRIQTVLERESDQERVRILFMIQSQGKRVAMGHALRLIARECNRVTAWHEDNGNDIVIFMDGDAMLCDGALEKTLPLFKLMPKLAVATVNNLAMTSDGKGLFQRWYDLKFAQRHHLFQSHSLSRRILTATGRFSAYRAGVILNEEFIRFVEADHLEHWLFGRFRFLMGDDKSTWFYLLKKGFEMLYVPDAAIVAIETRSEHFFRTSLSLMKRWYGNMLRNNARAIALGPKRMGFFIWWCLIDQRLTTWTPLVGLASAIMLAVFSSPFYFAFYLIWVCVSRLATLWIYVFQGLRLRSVHIPLLLYGQWAGAMVKLLTMYNLKRQTWDKNQRTNAVSEEGDGPAFGFMQAGMRYLLVTMNALLLFFFCGLLTNTLIPPPLSFFLSPESVMAKTSEPDRKVTVIDASRFGAQPGGFVDEAVRLALDQARDLDSVVIELPAGRLLLKAPVVIDRDGVVLAGAGRDKTILEARFDAGAGDAVVLARGAKGSRWGVLEEAARRGDRLVLVDPNKKARDADPSGERYLWIGAPNDRAFLDAIGSDKWDREYPWVRQTIAPLDQIKGNIAYLGAPLGLDFPQGAGVFLPDMLTGVVLRDFTVVQDVPGMRPEQATGVYESLAPQYAIDAIRLEWTAGCALRDVGVRMAGRHAVAVENSYGALLTGLDVDGAWNKGPGGEGYVRFARAYNCRLEDSVLRNIRHLAFQWSASGNVVERCRIGADVNFHGGYSHDNIVRDCVIDPPPGHPWGKVTRMPEGGGAWAPMDGPGNIVDFGAETEEKAAAQ